MSLENLENNTPVEENTTPIETEKEQETEIIEREDPFAAFEKPEFRTQDDVELTKKKKKRILIISLISAFVVLVTAVVLLVFVFPDMTEEPSLELPDTTVVLYDKTNTAIDTSIKSATIKNTDNTVEIVNIEDQLFVKGMESVQMHSINLGDLEDAMTTCTLMDDLGEVEDLSQYGFDKPKSVVTITFYDDTVKSFEIGDMTPDQNGAYFREKDSKHLYIMETEVVAIFLQKPLDYVSTTVLAEPKIPSGTATSTDATTEVVLRRMSLSGSIRKDKEFSFRLVTSEDSEAYIYYTYIITEPLTKGANSAYNTALNGMTSINAEAVVSLNPTAEELKTYGFDNPLSVSTFTLASRTTTNTVDKDGNTVANTVYKDLESHTVTIGKATQDYYYTVIDDNPIIYLVQADELPFATLQYDDMVDTLLFLEDITNMQSVNIGRGDKTTTFKLEHDDNSMDTSKNLKVTIDGKEYDSMDFRYLLQVFMEVKRYKDLTTDVSGLPVKAQFSITRRGETQPVVSAKFYQVSSSTYAVVFEHGERYLVRSSQLENALQQYDNYLAGKEVMH